MRPDYSGIERKLLRVKRPPARVMVALRCGLTTGAVAGAAVGYGLWMTWRPNEPPADLVFWGGAVGAGACGVLFWAAAPLVLSLYYRAITFVIEGKRSRGNSDAD